MVDLKIEIFAYKIFRQIWSGMLLIRDSPDILEIYGEECAKEDSYFEACDDCYLNAVYCRSRLFCSVYKFGILIRELKLKSLSEVYEYIVSLCDRDDLFGHLTVFEKMLATSEVVANFCINFYLINESFIDVLTYGHILWAMYFDKFMDEFYEKGGWDELKCEAESYKFFSEFSEVFYGNGYYYLQSVKEAVVNYYRFKNAIDDKERKRKNSVHVSKLWIEFKSEHSESHIYIPLSYEKSAKAYEVELLLKHLKFILDPSHWISDDTKMWTEKHQSFIFSSKMSHSEISSDTERMSVKPHDNMQIQHLVSENGSAVIDKTRGGFSHISTDCKADPQIGCLTSAVENLTLHVTEANRNLKGDEYKEMVLLNQSNSINSTTNSEIEQNLLPAVDMKMKSKTTIENSVSVPNLDLDGNIDSKSFINKNEDSAFEIFSEQNVAGQTEITNTDKVVFLPHMEKTVCHRNFIPEAGAQSHVLDFPNESISKCNKMEMSLNSTKDQIVTAEKESVSPMNQIVEAGLSLEPYVKDIGSVDENANCVAQMSNAICNAVARMDRRVRQEQKDPEINNFLKMILVLGDMEGAEFVLSTLENNKEGTENNSNPQNKKPNAERTSQKSSSQSKKKSKKKK